MNLFNWFDKWLSKMRYIWMLFALLVVSACQSAQSIATTPPQLSFTQISTIEPTVTELTLMPLPTFGAPTVTPRPVITEVASALTPNGPWLTYLRYGLSIVNQDGTGRIITERQGEMPVCDLDGIQENPLNRLIVFPGKAYLVQPGATWTLIYSGWRSCHTDFTGNEKAGFLATIYWPYWSTPDALPELRIYELPSGKLLNHFSLMKCTGQCNLDNVNWWKIRWSPNGRYLAFPAMLDGQSSDLYVYDSEVGSIRRLTSGPDNVGEIWWSPDGSQIIMGEIHDNNYPYISSLWVVSVSSNEIRLLYSLEHPYLQGLLGWLDDKRFIVYNGPDDFYALDMPAYNLRLVDMDTGKVTTLFNDSFMVAALDKVHETIAINGSGQLYIISISNPEPKPMRGMFSFPWWDEDAGLFVTYDPCEDDPGGRKAFDHKGELQCLHFQLPPESFSSPDGNWQVLLQDGFWLKANDQSLVRLNTASPTQIIWRLDSQGLFFIVNQTLYYTSLPELDIKIVDKYPGGDSITYQWVGSK